MVKNLREPLQQLSIAKGHMSSAMRVLSRVAEMVGDTPVQDDIGLTRSLGEENVGEVMYTLMMCLIPISKNLEATTNYLRKLEGLKPHDYSNSSASLLSKMIMEQSSELAIRLDEEHSGDGSPA